MNPGSITHFLYIQNTSDYSFWIRSVRFYSSSSQLIVKTSTTLYVYEAKDTLMHGCELRSVTDVCWRCIEMVVQLANGTAIQSSKYVQQTFPAINTYTRSVQTANRGYAVSFPWTRMKNVSHVNRYISAWWNHTNYTSTGKLSSWQNDMHLVFGKMQGLSYLLLGATGDFYSET